MPTKLKPIVQSSPTGFAKCVNCHQKIQKGCVRYGVPQFHQRLNKEIHRYYHEDCVPDNMKEKWHLKESKDQLLTERAGEIDVLIRRRSDLRERLRGLRLRLAREHHYSPFIIFNDATLDDLVIKLPTTLTDLNNIDGIKSRKSQQYGGPILEIIRNYRRHNENEKSVRRNLEAEFASVKTETIDEDATSSPPTTTSSGAPNVASSSEQNQRPVQDDNDDKKPEANKVSSTESPVEKDDPRSDCVPELVPSETKRLRAV
jgi:ribonuclease D